MRSPATFPFLRRGALVALLIIVTLGVVLSGPTISGPGDQSAEAAQLGDLKKPFASNALAPLTSGNILVTSNNTIFEYTPEGTQVQAIDVPYGDGDYPPTEDVRDITIDQSGNIAVYAGTFDPFLSTYDVNGDTWTHATHPGWSTVNAVSYGGIASFEQYVYVTDMGTDQARGIVRFDITDYSSERFADGVSFIDLTVGQDGFLYGLYPGGTPDGTHINVYDPLDISLLRTITLGTSVSGIAVNAAQEIFGASWDRNIYRFGSDGTIQQQMHGGTSSLTDIDAAADGQLVIGSRFGTVLLTDEPALAPSSLAEVPSYRSQFPLRRPHAQTSTGMGSVTLATPTTTTTDVTTYASCRARRRPAAAADAIRSTSGTSSTCGPGCQRRKTARSPSGT